MTFGYGYKVIFNGQVHAARTPEEAAGYVADAYRRELTPRLRKCESLTRDRDCTFEEQQAVVDEAARILSGVVA